MLRRYLILAPMLVAVGGLLTAGHPEYSIVPAGVEISVQLHERIDSKSASAGDTFAARVAAAVEAHGETLIPSGAPAKVELVVDHQIAPGDPQVFALALKAIQIDGKWYPVTTGFADVEVGVRKVRAGSEQGIPTGTTDLDSIIPATSQGESAALATIRGAGVTFHLLHGPVVEAASGLTIRFTLAELVTLRSEEGLN